MLATYLNGTLQDDSTDFVGEDNFYSSVDTGSSASTDDLMAQENADYASYDTVPSDGSSSDGSSSDGSSSGGGSSGGGFFSSSTAKSLSSLLNTTAQITGNSFLKSVAGITNAVTGANQAAIKYPAGTIYTQDPTTGLYRIATPTGSKFFAPYKEASAVAAKPPTSALGFAGAGGARLLGPSMPKLLGALGATSVDAATYATDTSTPTSTWIVAGAAAVAVLGGIAYAMHRSKKSA